MKVLEVFNNCYIPAEVWEQWPERHYFLVCGNGWVADTKLSVAIEKLDKIRGMAKLYQIWIVPASIYAEYEIEFFAPMVVGSAFLGNHSL